ncbi:hypothetical protein OG474_36740 [Kribbella sp. NBC_01505]|uniref:hypothetical protein n=1 Tax=Kribbella sp. NBC_01505 TaxID=2903580 RepID=UPI00386B0308
MHNADAGTTWLAIDNWNDLVELVGDAAERAQLARWNWKAKQARAELSQLFADRELRSPDKWCDFETSQRMTEEVEVLGRSRERVIQRWTAKDKFLDAASSFDFSSLQADGLLASVMDAPDAAWFEASAETIHSALIPAAAQWMSDGFIIYSPKTSSLFSVDVEQHDNSVIDTTLIGEGVNDLRNHLTLNGPLVMST